MIKYNSNGLQFYLLCTLGSFNAVISNFLPNGKIVYQELVQTIYALHTMRSIQFVFPIFEN